MTEQHPPTVIVARRFAPEHERDAERWLHQLREAAAAMPGHLDATTQPPNSQHPGEWVIVYRFESAETLDAWLTSDRRRELLDAGANLLVGDVREQVVVLPDNDESVTAVASFRLRSGVEADFRERYLDLRDALDRFDGFIRSELVEPVPGTQDDTVIVFSFTSRAALDRWLESDERRDALAAIDPLLAGERTVNVVGGFAGWFPASSTSTPTRWKQAALVLLALYPTALVLGYAREAILPDLTTPLAVLVGNVAGVAILSWILMPALTRRFDGWLRR